MWHANTAITYSTGHHPIFKIISKEDVSCQLHGNAQIATNGFLPVVVSGDTLMHAVVRMMPTLMWMLIWNNNSIHYSQCTSSTGMTSLTKIKKHFCDHDDINISNKYDDEILFDVPNFDDTLTVGSNKSTDETSCYFDDSSYDCSSNDNHHAALGMGPSTVMLQIRLNKLINNHKVSLKLHDNIVDLFNDYISSPFFDQHKKLTQRKQFMQRMEKTLHLKHLHPKFCDIKLYNKSAAIVSVFDAKAMILDILNNPTCMTQYNFADGYDVLTGSVDQNHPANQQYDMT
jgi:hypothetical protein